ncbi:MAG: hypothetical protein KDB70_16120 [Mycobacterium sp.]|nr:hypothetical protein [Mycobacterium sp.]
MKPARRQAAAAVLAAVGLLLSGCAQVHSGSAQRADGYDANAVNPALLDTGNYPTRPRTPLGTAGTVAAGAILEGHRMADHVVIPFQVDPALTSKVIVNCDVLNTPESVGQSLFTKGLTPAVAAHNFVTGFVAANTGTLQNAVLMFASDEDAAAAAAAMMTAVTTQTSPTDHTPISVTPIVIPGYADTAAVQWTVRYESLKSSDTLMAAVTGHGRYVLLQRLYVQQSSANDPMTLVSRTLDQQIPLIDGFTPTAPDQLVNLPMDPSGLQARMITPKKDERTAFNGSFGRHAALLFQPNWPVAAQKTFDELGVDLLINEDGVATRTKDAASAQKYLDWEATSQTTYGWHAIDGVAALPAARCQRKEPEYSSDTVTFWCGVAVDRVVLEITSSYENDAKQKLAASYLMLTAP